MNDEQYNELVGLLKAQQPCLTDPQKLTSDIMAMVNSSPKKSESVGLLRVVAWVSSIAALLLLGLFLYELPNSFDDLNRNNAVLPSYVSSMQLENAEPLDQINIIVRLKQERHKERELFYSNFIKKRQPF